MSVPTCLFGLVFGAWHFQGDQVEGSVVPLLSRKSIVSEERTPDDHSPTWQALAEGVYRFVWAYWSKIPSSNGLLVKVHRNTKLSWDNKSNCQPKAEVSICTTGCPRRTSYSKWQWHTVQVSFVWRIQIEVWIKAYYVKSTSPPGEWCCRKCGADLH